MITISLMMLDEDVQRVRRLAVNAARLAHHLAGGSEVHW